MGNRRRDTATTNLNLSLNFIFIKQYGVMGAAYATLISSILSFIIAQGLLGKKINVSLKNTFVYAYKFYPEFYAKYLRKSR